MAYLIAFCLLLLPVTAISSKLGLEIEPIIGYERVQKLEPTEHSRDRLMYGALLALGVPFISLEAEYLKGTDTETFTDKTIKDTDDRAKLGLRSKIRLGRFFSLRARAGVQAKQNIQEVTESGITNKTTKPIEYDPYAGLGLTAGLGRSVSLTGSVTAVFSQWPNMNRNEYQTSLSLSVALGSFASSSRR